MNTQTESNVADLYPSLTPLIVLERAFLDGALGIDPANDFLCALYCELEDGELKPSFLHREFKDTLGSMSNHDDKHVAFMAKDLLRELPLQSSLPWNDLNQRYWENGYTKQVEDLLMQVDEKQPAIVEGWNSYVIAKKPYNDKELDADFVLANLSAESHLPEEDQFEDRGYEPEGFKPDIELTNDWLTPMSAFRQDYYASLQELRESLKDGYNAFLSSSWVYYGNLDGAEEVATFCRETASNLGQLLDKLITIAPRNEIAQALYSLEAMEMPVRLLGTKKADRGTQLQMRFAYLDLLLTAVDNHPITEFPGLVHRFCERWEEELLEKLTSDGSLFYSQPTYERIEEMADIALRQILSTYSEYGDAKDTMIWNEGYIRAVIEDGIPDANDKAWQFYRHALSIAGAMAFDTAETVSEGWKLFNIVSRAAGEIHDVVVEFGDDFVIIAPEHNPTYQRRISWGLAMHKLRKNEFAPSPSAFGKSNEIARTLAMMIPSPAVI